LAFFRIIEIANAADGPPEFVDCPCPDASEVGLEFGEWHFDGVQIWRVGWQEQESGAALPENGCSLLAFVAGQTATAWLTLASDRSILDVNRRTLASAQASVDLARKRFEGDIASQLDLRQAETIAQEARAQIAQSVTSIAQTQNALQLLVGAPVPEALQPTALDDRVALLTTLPANVDSSVLLTRPDVLSAEHDLHGQFRYRFGARRLLSDDLSYGLFRSRQHFALRPIHGRLDHWEFLANHHAADPQH
jgi:hypothetical protein